MNLKKIYHFCLKEQKLKNEKLVVIADNKKTFCTHKKFKANHKSWINTEKTA